MAEFGTYAGSEAHGRAPGVYIEDIRAAPAAALATGVPLFIGFSQTGTQLLKSDGNEKTAPVRLSSWQQFEQRIGHAASGSFLGYAVRGFFENGGARCVVVPLKIDEAYRSQASLVAALENLLRKDENGLRGILNEIDETDLVCVPDIMMEEVRASEDSVFELQRQVLEYCKDMGERFAILDVLPGDPATPEWNIETYVEKVIEHWQQLLPPEGAIYFPWVRVKPLNGSGHPWVPPCGHIAGIYARTDAQVGFHKAPANEIVEGVLDLAVEIAQELQGQLTDIGVNCLSSFVRRGIRIWGARTLSGHSNWRYINVRRIFLTLVRWIEHNTNDLVFESNGPPLWARVRDRLGGYCYELFQLGALKGQDPAEAFFVKCDAETNPLDVREAGQLICEIGLAPLAPAEFIVIRIIRNPAGASATLVTG